MNEQVQIGWAENPRKGKSVFPWKIERTPHRRSLDFTIISPRTLGCFTHWFGDRTFPHRVADCPACEANVRMDYHAYFGALTQGNFRQVIIEVTERVDGILLDWLAKHRTLRGAVVSLKRMGDSPASKIHVKIADELVNLPEKISTPNLREILAHIWRLPAADQNTIEEHPPHIHEPETGGPSIELPQIRRA